MKKYFIFLILLVLWGCLEVPSDDTDLVVDEDEFALNVPSDFDWSCITGAGLTVNIKKNGNITSALDNTMVELYDENNVLLDALTILGGMAEFNVRIPKSVEHLNVKIVASGESVAVDANAASVDYEVKDISAIVLGGLKSAADRVTGSASYVIFEDLWPSKGDYDFNDIVVKTEYSWVRDKKNYIENIDVVCNVECIGAGMKLGLGFELFEAKGTNLYYLGDIITDIQGAEKDNSVRNGVIAFSKVQDIGENEITFSVNLKEEELKEFVFIPYLFRTNSPDHQVRPYGAPPTEGQDMSLFHTKDDTSPRTWSWEEGKKFKYPLSESEAFYRSKDNYPWGIEFITNKKFQPCQERISILIEYPSFKSWAESGGKNGMEWYDNHS